MKQKIYIGAECDFEHASRIDEQMYNEIMDIIGDIEDNIEFDKNEKDEKVVYGIILTVTDPEFLLYIIQSITKELRRDAMIFAHPEPWDMQIILSRHKYEE